MLVSAVSFVAIVASALLGAKEMRRRDSRVGLAWGVWFCVLEAAVGVMGMLGMMPNDLLSGLVLNAVLVACAWGSFAHDLVWQRVCSFIERGTARAARTFAPNCAECDKYDTCAHRITKPEDLTLPGRVGAALSRAGKRTWLFLHQTAVVRTMILMLAGLFAMLALEIPSNHDLTWAYPLCLLLEWSLITAVMIGLYHLFQRHGVAAAVVAFVLWGVGMAEFFVITFKSMPIQPADLSALKTAAAVSAGYDYIFSPFGLYGMAFLAVSMFLCSVASAFRTPKPERTRKMLLTNLIIGALCLGGVAAHVTLIDYYNTLNITVYTWRPLESYYRQGFLPTFISSAQTIKPPVPAEYDMDAAQKLEDELAATYDEGEGASTGRTAAQKQFDQEKPAVVAIMNETFSDLSVYQNMHAGYEGPQFFKNLPDALSRGKLYVSAYGGGTCNTEFEFLTGNSMSYLGSGVYPYTIYDLTETNNLAEQFKELGYTTTAMHPNHGTNWNRENVYAGFGFDEFLAIEDFQNADKLRGMVTDEATYDAIIEMLKTNESPQFIFDVTMQNHSGYETGLLPASKQLNLSIDGEVDPEVNEYLSLIEESDRALEKFIGELRELDRPVVVVFFGDHQPFFPDKFNDRFFPGEDKTAHAMRLWQTDYLVWANYDVAGRDQKSTTVDLSTNYLGTSMMDLIGAPLTPFQKAQMTLRQALPAINTTGYLDAASNVYLSSVKEAPESDASTLGSVEPLRRALEARQQYATVQYLELFGDGKDVYSKQHQSAANETDPNLAPGTTQIK
ncbi:MAG: LTA synthase family protein [Coriobacteriaceae bacterium]|nr:LTA synthase family protein [Coriobacteriaceae bacterium]